MWLFSLVIILILELINYLYFLRIKKLALKKEYYYGDRFDLKIRNDFKNHKNQIKYCSNFIEFNKFENTDLSDIPIDAFIKFLLSLYFNKSKTQSRYKHLEIVYLDAQRFSKKYNINFTNNLDSDKKKFNRFGQSDIQCSYKPIILSILMLFVKYLGEFLLRLNGFDKYYSYQTNICYWSNFNKPNIKITNKVPVMFIHGLGVGIIPYLNFIFTIGKNRNVICPVLPNISNIYFHPFKFNLQKNDFFPSFDVINHEINNIFQLHKIYQCDIISHSFGTFIASSLMLKSSFRARLRKKIFIDPVCFHSNLTKVLKSVDIKKLEKRKSYIMSEMIHYFIYLDVYVKYATKRNLFSMEFLWGDYSYLDDNTLIYLSGNDAICDSEEIYQDIYKSGFSDKVIWLDEADHGDLFMTNNWNHEMNTLKKFIL